MLDKLKTIVTGRDFLWFVGGLLVIAVVSFAFFYPDASQGNVLQQYDTQQGIANGQEAKAFHEATGETTRWTNSLFSGMPTFQISPTYPSSGLYTWINTVMGLGLPQPANLIAMMMVGFFILLYVMRVRPPIALLGAVAYGFSTYFVILIGAGHIWKFVTLAYVPPTIAGIILAYRGRYLAGGALAGLFAMMQISANHAQMSYYFLFVIIAIVIACLYDALRSHRMTQFWIATCTLIVAAGLAIGANLPSLYNTYEYSKETMRGQHSELTPTGDNVEKGQSPSNGLDKDYITQYSYQPSETFTLLIPNVKGGASARPEQGQMKALSLANLPAGQEMINSGQADRMQAQYLEYMSQYFGDPEGTNGPVYVGALIFALFLVGCVIVRGPMKWVLLLLTLFAIALAWGKHAMVFTDIMLTCVPMYAKFRTVESILVIAEFTMPLLAALALQKIVTTEDKKSLVKPICYCFGISIIICLAGLLVPGIFGELVSENDRQIDQMIKQQLLQNGYPAQQVAQFSLQNPDIYSLIESLRSSLVETDALRSLMVLLVGFAFIMLYLKRKVTSALAVTAVMVVTLFDLFAVNKRYLSHDSFVPKNLTSEMPIPKTPADEIILLDTTMNYRVMDLPRFYVPAPSYYHKMIGGYHAAKLTRYQDLIDHHLSHFTEGQPSEADWNVLNMLNAKYIVTGDGKPIMNPEAMGNAWMVDKVSYVPDADREMEALSTINPRKQAVADRKFESILGTSQVAMPGDTIYETTYAPNRLTYKAKSQKGGVAVFSEVYFPWGWKATIDGKPAEIGRVNYALRAMKIPAGEHEIVMEFNPASVTSTDVAAKICVIMIYVLVCAAVATAFVTGPARKKGE